LRADVETVFTTLVDGVDARLATAAGSTVDAQHGAGDTTIVEVTSVSQQPIRW